MAYEQHLTSEALADRISRWRPEDGPMIYFASESFTADAPDVQKFNVSSTSEDLKTEKRAKASRYTVGDITDMDKCGDEVVKACEFLLNQQPRSLVLFEATAPIITLRILLGTLQGNNAHNEVLRFEERLGLDFTPYWKHLLKGASTLGKFSMMYNTGSMFAVLGTKVEGDKPKTN